MSTSPDRWTFQQEKYKQVLNEDPTDEHARGMIDFYKSIINTSKEIEQTTEWKQYNLEYDLRVNETILNKVRTREEYAQNLYAALCNNDFVKNEMWPLLKEQTWGCSWRYAGGIIAHMRQEGDYIDWYCSGIQSDWSDEEFRNANKENQERYLFTKNRFVGEGTISDEVREDLKNIGWVEFTKKSTEL